MVQKRVLGVIGLGHVGAHIAYALAIQGIADELLLVDQNEQKLASEVQDLRDAVAYLPHRVTVRAGDFADLGACDVIVNSVGKIDLLRGTALITAPGAVRVTDAEGGANDYTCDDILIATEVGGGVVPMDVKQRADREAAGRLACLLAARAECVVQMFCGIPTVLKGELSQC